jgi:O-antigen/teichoic acid export membrane protein
VITILLCGVVLVFWPAALADLLGVPDAIGYLWMIPVGALLTAWYLIGVQVAVRLEAVSSVALRNFLMPVVTVAVQLLAGWAGPTTGGLVLGYLAGRSLAAFIGIRTVRSSTNRTPRPRVLSRAWWQNVTAAVRRFKWFPLVGAPAALLNVLGLQLPVILVGAVFGVADAGAFGLAYTATMLPVVAVSAALIQLVLGRVARHLRDGSADLFGSFLRWSLPTGMASIVVGGAVYLAAPLAHLVLGEDWKNVAPIVQALSLLTACRMFAASLAPTLSLLERHGLQVVADASRVAVILLVMLLVDRQGASLVAATVWLSAAISVSYLVSWFMAAYAFKAQQSRSPRRSEPDGYPPAR